MPKSQNYVQEVERGRLTTGLPSAIFLAGFNFYNMMQNMLTPLRVVIAVEILGTMGIIFGFLPREAALFLLGIFAYFALFASRKDAILFTVFSIPLFTALPITDGFDTMVGWRIIILILFLRAVLKSSGGLFSRLILGRPAAASEARANLVAFGDTMPNQPSNPPREQSPRTLFLRLEVLLGLFFAVSALSLFIAQEPSFGIRKVLFLINIFALFFVIQLAIKSKQDWLDIFKYTFAGGLVSLTVGYAQLVSVFFVVLHNFWMWWVGHVIPVFYGMQLTNLLSYANTWFSYYENAEPTLRVFSIFPDSHSFALAMVLLLSMALTYYFVKKQTKKSTAFPEIVIILALLAIIFSGTRGIWVGAIPVLVVLAAAFFTRNFPQNLRQFSKMGLIILFVFAVLFPVASQIQKISQWSQGGQVSDTTTFSRISTSFRIGELSNKGRIQIWKSTIESIIKRPLLGVGIGNYPVVLSENVSATKKGASAHSLYLDFIAEIGIFGGIVVLLIFLEILRQALKIFSAGRDLFFTAFAGFFAIFLLWVMAYSIVDVVLLNDKVLLFFVSLVGLLYVIPKTDNV